MQLTDTLAERGARYGDFSDHAVIAQALQDRMREAPGWARLDAVKRQALTVIADKIARVLSGDPEYADSWHDIRGYAKLVEDRLLLPSPASPGPSAPVPLSPHAGLQHAVGGCKCLVCAANRADGR